MKPKRKSEVLTMTLDELKTAGATNVEISYNHHIKLRFDYLGKSCLFVVPHTPSSWRAVENQRRDLKRLLREKGEQSDARKTT